MVQIFTVWASFFCLEPLPFRPWGSPVGFPLRCKASCVALPQLVVTARASPSPSMVALDCAPSTSDPIQEPVLMRSSPQSRCPTIRLTKQYWVAPARSVVFEKARTCSTPAAVCIGLHPGVRLRVAPITHWYSQQASLQHEPGRAVASPQGS